MPSTQSKNTSSRNRQAAEPAGNKVEVKAQIKNGKMRGRNVTVLLDADDIVKDQVGGFVNFMREHAIVGLAVGFAIGTQAQTVVKQLVTSFIDPAFSLFFGGSKLSERTFTLHLGNNAAHFGWGAIVYSLINLLFVLAVIYALIKVFKLDKLDKKKDAAAAKTADKPAKESKAKKKSS